MGKRRLLALLIAVLMVTSLIYPVSEINSAKAASDDGFIISEYVEGSSYNKAIELYNGTGSTITLSNYKLCLYSNGASSPSNTLNLLNVDLAPDSTYVIVNDNSSSTDLKSKKDLYNHTVINFNGDDALSLDRISDNSHVDVFGTIGQDPGSYWGDSSCNTKDHTLVKKASVLKGNPSGFTDPSIEWDCYPQDDFSHLGSHTMNHPTGADLSITITSLESATIGDPNPFEYTVEYKNIGDANADGVTITDTLPAGVTYQSDDSGVTPTNSGNTYTWSIGTVSAGADVTFHIEATVDSSVANGTILTNNISISTTSAESNTDNNSSSCNTTATDIWPIKDARNLASGTAVKVQGSVTLTPGTLDSSNKEMYIQDETGGIDVFYYSGGLPNLQLGDLVTVSGNISIYHNKIQIKPNSASDVAFSDYGGFVVPYSVTSTDISDYLGSLVYTSGTVSDKGSNNFSVNGIKIYIDFDTGIDISKISNGDTVTVVGIADQYYSTYEIILRYQYDVAEGLIMPIGNARILSSGTVITTQGVITSGEVFSGGKAFFAQDGTGGIEVYGVSGLSISEGDLVQVTGSLGAYNGLKQISISSASDVTEQGFTGITTSPKLDKTGEVDQTRESLLVKVSGIVSNIHSSYFYIDDGSGTIKVYDSSSDVSFSGISNGDNITVIGLVGEYKGTMEIFPRTQSDIIFNRPSVTSTNPANNATNVDINTTVSATFDRDMDESTITTSTFTLKDSSSNLVSGAVSYDASSKTATFTPDNPLAENETYAATISSTVKDADGNEMGSDYVWSFSTGVPQVITIAQARAKSVGDVVYVEGNVTVSPGTFNKGFAIQDSTGGIYVYNTGDIENFELGDAVKVKGILTSYNGLLEISADNSNIEFVSHGSAPAPQTETTGAIGEDTEGLMVSISGTVKSISGSTFTIDDGSGPVAVYTDSDTGISLAGMEVGDIAMVIGFSSQYDTSAPYDSGYQVMPRFQSDISFTAVPIYQGPCPTTPRQVAPDSEQGVKILEIMYNSLETGSNENGEAVRIINTSNNSIDISGWQITDNEASVNFPAGTVLQPKEKLWIARNAIEFEKEFGKKPDFEYGIDSDPTVQQMDNTMQYPIFDNVADEYELLDVSNKEVDAIVWGSGCTTITGWSGSPVQPYIFASYIPTDGDIIYRKLGETTGMPVPDTDTLSDWSTDPNDPINGCKVMYPGWDTVDDFFFTPKDTAKVHTTFMAAPDNTFKGITDFIDSAKSSIKIEVYLFTNYEIADHIIAKLNQGKNVTAVFDGEVYGAPGGTYDSERYIAKEIVDHGGTVYFLRGNGDHDRYNNIHAKFIIVDDSKVFISSENFSRGPMPSDDKSNGTAGNRGSAVITDDSVIVQSLVKIFNHDCDPGYYDVSPYDPSRDAPPANFTYDPPSDKTGYTPLQPNPLSVHETESLELIDSPDTSARNTDSLIGLINKAGNGNVIMEEAQYEYVYWGPSGNQYVNPRLQALTDAAKRGTQVYILLNGAYGVDANTAAKNYVELQSANIHCLLGTPTGSGDYGAYPIHNKQFIMWIGGKGYIHIGSINGSENSSRANREMALQIQSNAGFNYYKKIFDYDWSVSGGGSIGINHAPEISVTPQSLKIPSDAVATTKIHASDPDGDPLTISVTADPKPFGLYSIKSNNLFRYYPSSADENKTFTFTFTAKDPDGLHSSATFEVTVFKKQDHIPPKLSLPDIEINAQTVTNKPIFSFTIVASDDSGRIVKTIVKDNGIIIKDVAGLPIGNDPTITLFEGINDITVTVYDASGNSTSKKFRVISDTRAPIVEIVNLPKTVSSKTLTLTGKAFDQTTGVKLLSINGKVVVVSASGKFKTDILLEPGKNAIKVVAVDKAGNKFEKTYQITYVQALSTSYRIIVLQINNPKVTINGISKTIDAQGSKPIIENDRTLLPIRALIESLGGQITWNGETREVTINLSGHTIILTIDKNTAVVGGIKMQIDPNNGKVTPIIINGRTYLPLRFIAEHLNAVVDWDNETRTVTIYYWP